MESEEGTNQETLIDTMARLYRRNKQLLETWEGFFSSEFIENMFRLKDTRSALEKFIGEKQAFETSKNLYYDIFDRGL